MSDPLISDELSDEPSDFGSLRPGTRLGRYELLVPIARGGMARVWAARQHGTRGFQKLVAIKTILPHLAEEPEFERMFLDEARIASGVHHPNVCEIYELGEERRTLYLAMEWVNGDSFSRALRVSGKVDSVDFGIAARILADACAGAHAAHELEDDHGQKQNVVHRDLSPHNILVNWDGFTKVCDFGVAKALNQLHEVTSAGQLKGKISYMSPEQVTGDPVDRRSDIFSLGCVLYEATVGRRPFRGEGDHNVMQAIVNGGFDMPSSIVRNYPRDLERVVVRALAHVPNQRFASAELMRFALEEYLVKSGTLVTQSHVGAVVRTRLGEMLEKRRDRIRRASAQGEQGDWSPASVPPSREPVDHRSGVKQSRSGLGSVPASTRGPLDSAPTETTNFGQVPAHLRPQIHPSSSSTIPHVQTSIVESLALTPQLGVPSAQDRPRLEFTPRPDLGPRPEHTGTGSQNAIEEAIKSSLVPSPLEPPPPSTSLPPRSVIEARAMTQPGRDVPIPIMSPLGGPPPVGGGDPPTMPPSDFAELLDAQPPQRTLGQYALAAFVGLLFACVIGGGCFYYWKARQQLAVAPPPVTAQPAATASATPEVAFRISPADAVLVVDGQPKDKKSVPRPAAGQSTAVVVRAKGFDDSVVQIDYFSALSLDVTLKESVEAGAAPPASASVKKPKPRKDKDPTALPDNPY